ncbi:glutaredoxin domain-containing cysteine-rich protein 2 [Coturnix japonica]|uniref:Glutaredoxin and cysteine rich domain containing 2 n=1 Tax=Coturnix japonica TaxID=93934 RepID=A0A8C2UGI0_COTJA|nr:glutaredoxin domain-containing cysteine-rich protein 2 [Coturnix japonica]
MDEPQRNPGQRPEGRPRKVRFRISSACSGRVLKQVYEDGQALEPPTVEQSRRLRHSFEPAVLPDGPALGLPQSSGCGEDGRSPGCPPAGSGLYGASPVIDFGQIIIYTNNLKIIRAPMDQRELMRRIIQTEGVSDWAFVYRERRERIGAGHRKDVEKKAVCNQYMQERGAERTCSQCKGSGCAPCSLCHGSKFSMLANRFKESYRALRCPACNESGVQPCQVCAA